MYTIRKTIYLSPSVQEIDIEFSCNILQGSGTNGFDPGTTDESGEIERLID